jgi:hypothetical protein
VLATHLYRAQFGHYTGRKGSVYQRIVKNRRDSEAYAYAKTAKATAPATKAPNALLELAAPVNCEGAGVVATGLEGAGVVLLGTGAGVEAGGAGGAGLLLGATGVDAIGAEGGAGLLLGATGVETG